MNRFNFSYEVKKNVLVRDHFSCQKCGFQDSEGKELEIHHRSMRVDGRTEDIENLITLCSICHHYAPEDEAALKNYLNEKLDGKILDTFRKSGRSISKRTKKGMTTLFNEGKLITRAPLGYKIINKTLVPAENSYIAQEIYQAFLNSDTSLTQLAKKFNLSVNGLKKVLSNETYLGKVKFAGQVLPGKHTALILQELFDKVREKLGKI